MLYTSRTHHYGSSGIWYGVLSATTFGLIPLFSIPEIEAGMSTQGVLFYRFLIACILMFGALVFNRKDLKISIQELSILLLFGLLYDGSAVCLYYGYRYMSSGAATTLIFMYPVWTAIIMAVFFRERLAPQTILAILLAISGVFFLSGGGSLHLDAPWYAPVIVLMSGLSYSIYMVLVDRLKVRTMGSLKLTFYTLLFALFFLSMYQLIFGGGVDNVPDIPSWINLILLALVPTVFSNLLLIKSIQKIGSTLAAILGAFEPVIAVFVGVSFLGESFTLRTAFGIILIIFSVMLLVKKKKVTVIK